jgi:hypothetical protein
LDLNKALALSASSAKSAAKIFHAPLSMCALLARHGYATGRIPIFPQEENMRKALWFILLVVPMTLSATDLNTGSSSSAAGFERLKALAGTWQVAGKMGKAQSTYEVVANGSTVIERFTMDGMSSPMVTAYHLDGDKLELTHYCMAGNQPSMVAKGIDPASGEIVFDFASVTNLTDPNAKYMHNATYQLTDSDHFTTAWTLYENGKPKFTETSQYTRVK